MITSSIELNIAGINYQTEKYHLRMHSICNPRCEKSKDSISRKLSALNQIVEKHLLMLIGVMNSRGLRLFTDDEERVRQDYTKMGRGMSKFICDFI